MNTPSVASLELQVRQITDRVNDPTLTSAVIIGYLNDGLRSMYDLFLDSVPHWVQSRFDFTLVGDSDTTSRVALPDDFQIDLGLDWLNPPGVTYPITIRRLPTFLDRNRLNPYNTLALSPAFYDRNYDVQGADLRVYPPMNCGGDYRLFYQVQIAELALPVTVDFNIATGDTPQVPPPGSLDGTGAWLLANANPDAREDIPTDGGFNLTLTFTTTNLAFSGTYAIVSFGDTSQGFGQPTFGASNLASGVGYSNPATGTGTYTFQPAGTIGELPQVFAPWQLYIKTFAAISVMTSFQENVDTLSQRLAGETARVRRMAERRESDLRQIPILSGGRGVDSPNFDSGNGGGFGSDW